VVKPSNDREAITLIMDGLRDVGVLPTQVYDGEDVILTETTAEVVEAVCAVDEASVMVTLPPGAERADSHIFFVLGNSPEEVACDHGVSLSPFIDPIVTPWWD
jgi:hypothetical protein